MDWESADLPQLIHILIGLWMSSHLLYLQLLQFPEAVTSLSYTTSHHGGYSSLTPPGT